MKIDAYYRRKDIFARVLQVRGVKGQLGSLRYFWLFRWLVVLKLFRLYLGYICRL